MAGYDIVPNVLTAADVRDVREALAGPTFTRSRAGARHLMGHPLVIQVAHDPRLLGIARRFVGAAPVPFRGTLFDKSPQQNWLVAWHQDTALPLRDRRAAPGWGPWSIKRGVTYAHAPASALSRVIALRLHLDDSGAANGPLRVLPGTHTLGVLSDQQVGRLARETTAVDCLVPAGGVVAMRPLIIHASSKSATDQPRRVLHIEYAGSLEIDGLQLAVA